MHHVWSDDARLDGDAEVLTSSAPNLVAVIQARFIVIGHVLGVVAAHERAVTLFPARSRSPVRSR